jgi:hypothetical protein
MMPCGEQERERELKGNDLRRLLRPYNPSTNSLTPLQVLLQTAAYRLITIEQFQQVQQASRGRGSADIKRLVWPQEIQRPEARKVRSRPDVAERMKAAGDIDHTVVTWTWHRLCKAPAHGLPLKDALLAANKVTLEALELANIHVLRMCRKGKAVPVLDQTFFYRCCNAVCVDESGDRVMVHADAELDETAKQLAARRAITDYQPVTQKHMRPILQVLSRDMATAAANMVRGTYYRRFYRWVRATLDCSSKYASRICGQVWEDDRHKPSADPFVMRARAMLPDAPLNDRYIHLYVPQLYAFQRSSTSAFSLLPHKGNFKTSYLTINTNTLRALLLMAGVKEVPKEERFLQDKALWWRRMFDVRKLETSRRTFAYEVSTDGRGVSVVMTKPKRKATAACEPLLPALAEGVTVRSVDPGARCLFTSAGITYHGQGEPSVAVPTRRCTGGEFYHKAGYTRAAQKEREWLQSTPEVAAAVKDVPQRRYKSVTDGITLLKYLWPRLAMMMDHYGAGRYKNTRMSRRIGAARQLTAMCRELVGEGKDKASVIIGFGDWSATTHHRTSTPGPARRFRRELARYATVVDVDESYTSKTCSCCHQQRLENMRCRSLCTVRAKKVKTATGWSREVRTKEVRTVKVHGVLHCTNSDCQGKTWDRDLNAARNILEITMCRLLGWPRPRWFAKQQ